MIFAETCSMPAFRTLDRWISVAFRVYLGRMFARARMPEGVYLNEMEPEAS